MSPSGYEEYYHRTQQHDNHEENKRQAVKDNKKVENELENVIAQVKRVEEFFLGDDVVEEHDELDRVQGIANEQRLLDVPAEQR